MVFCRRRMMENRLANGLVIYLIVPKVAKNYFKLTEDQKKALKDNGYKATIDYLENLN